MIFATAYDEYACKAFDLHAVDYVVKPFDLERVAMTHRAAERAASSGGCQVRTDLSVQLLS